MFAGEASPRSVDGAPGPRMPGYGVGDRVLVLVGDTLLPGVIESMNSAAGAHETEWNVRRHGAARAYPVPEDFLQYDMTSQS